jgi:hypothetical protein
MRGLIVGQHIRGGRVAVEPAGLVLGDQILIRLRLMPWMLSPGFLLESPGQLADSQAPYLSTLGVQSNDGSNLQAD